MGKRFSSLDGMRGIAALAVLIRHVPDRTIAEHWLSGSYMAVDLFFVMSGFVLAHAYGERLSTGLPVVTFFKLRLARLYPLYLAGLALAAVDVGYWFYSGHPPEWRSLAASFGPALLFLPTISAKSGFAFPANYPAWSLFWELFANLLFGWIMLRPNFQRSSWIAVTAGLVGLAGLAAWRGNIDAGVEIQDFWLGAPRVLYGFFAGVLIHGVWKRGIVRWTFPFWLSVTILLGIFAAPMQGASRAIWDFVSATVLLPVLVIFSLGRKDSALSSGLGDASYAVYVIQAPLIILLNGGLLHLGINLSAWGALGTGAIALSALIAALLLDRLYDAPVRNWLSRLAYGNRPKLYSPI